MNKDALLKKLNSSPFSNSEITRIANTGDFVAASEYAAKSGVWGIWGYCREVAGLSFDESARQELTDKLLAEKKVKYARK